MTKRGSNGVQDSSQTNALMLATFEHTGVYIWLHIYTACLFVAQVLEHRVAVCMQGVTE